MTAILFTVRTDAGEVLHVFHGDVLDLHGRSSSVGWGIGKKSKFMAYRPATDAGKEVELDALSVQSAKGNTTVLKGSKKALADLAVRDVIRSK